MTTGLEGRAALVTGGGSGIGAAIAERLARGGAHVLICGRRVPPLERVANELPNCSYRQTDVGDEGAVVELFSEMAPPDIVVANAGAAESAPVERTDLALWSHMIDANLTSAFLVAREGVKVMKKGNWGRIVFVGSTAGLKGYPYVSAYCAAKHGIIGLTRSLALETARYGITVNAVCPGYTDTPMLEKSIDTITRETGMDATDARRALLSGNPMGRFIRPEEVASAVEWLCLDSSGSISGQAIGVSGGEA